MNNEKSESIKILCILSFIAVALTSIPLLSNYLNGTTPKYAFVVNLHVWSGVVFIIFAIMRIVKNKIIK